MATFPGAVPSYTASDPSKTLYQDGHAARHNAVQDDVSAIATKLGTGASTPSANTVLRGTGAGASAYGKVALASEVSGVLPVANGGTGASTSTGSGAVVLATSPTLATPTLTTPIIGDFSSAIHDHQDSAGGGQLTGDALSDGSVSDDKWLNGVAFYAYKANNQSVSAATFTKTTLSQKLYDLGSNFDNSSTYRFVAPVAGIYHFTGCAATANNDVRLIASIYKNGSEVLRGTNITGSSDANRCQVTGDLLLSATDYIELFAYRTSAGNIITESTHGTFLCGHLVTRV